MSGETISEFRTNLKHDFLASVVVFLVALPLCMGISIASGAPVAAGLVTGIVGGLLVGMFSGSPLQVSGPAAGLAVIVYEIIQGHGLEAMGMVVLIAGLLQVAAGTARLGQWFRAVSPAVIKGMLAGIGVLIFASQFHVMVDDDPRGSGIANLASIPSAVWKGLGGLELESSEIRQSRAEALREFGELHRRQSAILEELSRHEAELAKETERPRPSPESILAHVRQPVASVASEMESLIGKRRSAEAQARSRERAETIDRAAAAALDSSRAAATAVAGNDFAVALEAQRKAVNAQERLFRRLKNHGIAAKLGLLTIVIMIVWGMAPKRLRILPGPLIAVSAATAVAALLTLPVLYVEVPSNLLGELRLPDWSVLSSLPWGTIGKLACVVAAVASAETLLSATAVDQLHTGPRARYDKELVAQGIGNSICGLLGALPMTGVIVRSSANVQAGGRTRLSTILHGAWLLIFVAGLSFLLRMIPTASLAAVLVYTGYKLVDLKSLRDLWKYGRGEVAIYVVTLVTIVTVDLLTGVLLGVGLAAARLLYTFSHLETRLEVKPQANRARLVLAGAATFLRLPQLARQLEQVPNDAELHVDIQRLDYLDHACLDLLMNWAKQHEATGGSLDIDWDSLRAHVSREERPADSAAQEAA